MSLYKGRALNAQPINPENRSARFPCRGGCGKLIDPRPPGCAVPRWYCGWECEEKAAKAGRNTETVHSVLRSAARDAASGTDGDEWRWEEESRAVKRATFACAAGHQHGSKVNADLCEAAMDARAEAEAAERDGAA